jgi:undecaprenyl diphosphate synthase
MKIPDHIAFIMDGNGRWAKKRRLPRFFGHKRGVDTVRKMVRAGNDFGINYLTFYTFSSENWQRPKREINELMKLLTKVPKQEEPELQEKNVRVKLIGRIDDLPEAPRSSLQNLVANTAKNTGLTMILAINYGGRNEIMDGVKQIIALGKTKQELRDEDLRSFLYEPEIPDPDLLIRTGGEKRISNFLIYQMAYTELYFTETLWPDFDKKELQKAIDDFAKRKRRFGRVYDIE